MTIDSDSLSLKQNKLVGKMAKPDNIWAYFLLRNTEEINTTFDNCLNFFISTLSVDSYIHLPVTLD